MNFKKQYVCWLVPFFAGIMLYGCTWSERGRETYATLPAMQSARYEQETVPVTVSNWDEQGRVFTQDFTVPPQRIVAAWQNSIETLLALGAGDRIIAAVGLPDVKYLRPEYRKQYNAIPVKSLYMLDLETVLMLEPDFIVGWYSTFSPKTLRSPHFWRSRGIHSYMAGSSIPVTLAGSGAASRTKHRVAEEIRYILDLGRIVDRSAQAREIVKELENRIRSAQRQARKSGASQRALVIELLGKDIVVYGEKTLAGDMVQSLGGELLAAAQRNIGREDIIRLNPDVVFLVVTETAYDEAPKLMRRLYDEPAFNGLAFVQQHRAHILPLYTVYAPGVRVQDGIEIISHGLYPEVFPAAEAELK
ncbi:MAG: ABC transporter substrate-binding protein [Veillonellaceae bacterium]|nr:ABC transporter substrate-binding protein [Veillonellaceae bacterium]